MNDADMGAWTYAYDRQSHLIQQTDACGNLTVLVYEPILQRLSSQQFSQGATCATATLGYTIAYTYDTYPGATASARGQLTGVSYSDNSYQKALTYNAQGLPTSTSLMVGGLSYTTQTGYDAYQRPLTSSNPSGEVVSTAYNSVGLPTQVQSSFSTPALVNAVNYDEASRVTSLTFPAGGNLVRTQTYAPFNQPDNNGGQLQATQVYTGTLTRLQLGYTYDSFGNLKTLTDAGTTNAFTYDDQNRLTNAYARPYAYDSAGRLTNYENTPTAVNNTFPVHALKSPGYTYDANGNATTRPGQTLTWDTANHLQSVTGSGLNESYLYDETGQRLQKVSNGQVTTNFTADDTLPETVCAGQTGPGANWQVYSSNGTTDGLFLEVDTSRCGFSATPRYFSGLTGNGTALTSGGSSIYLPTATGFRIYVRYTDGRAPSVAEAQQGGWRVTWRAAPDQTTASACTGATPAGSTAWQADGHGGLTLAVNTSACGFTTIPIYQTALNGASNHWATSGVTTILTPTPTGFRVQVTYLPGPITPATANQLRWQVNWRATPLRHTYSFAEQHIAQRQGKTFTYLHTDHLGSTLLATDQTGAVVGGNQPRYAAYGRERMPSVAALPTDYTFTGQKQDGTGLIYMSARYYDPQLGTFISPDSMMPDPSRLADYNRYLYARGNPMKYTDPTGHCGIEGIINIVHVMHSPCEMGGPEAAVETAMAADVESAAIAAQAETATVAEAATPLVSAVNAADGTVVYDAPALSGIEESGTAGETTTTSGVNPSSINFSQRSVSANVNQYTNDMADGKWDWSKSGPARVMNRDGQWVTYDNRRVMAAQNAGLEKIPVEVVSSEDFMPGSKRTWGQAFTRRFNDPRNIELGGPVPLQGLSQQPIVSPRGPR